MEYFKEKNGKYVSKLTSSNSPGKIFPAIAVAVLPLIVGGIIYFNSVKTADFSMESNPIFKSIGILMVVNLAALFFRKIGITSGITVDQMERTVKYKRPGAQQKTLDLDTIRKIKLQINPGKAAVLSLVTQEGKDSFLTASKDIMMIRQMADELSALISVTVAEESVSSSYK